MKNSKSNTNDVQQFFGAATSAFSFATLNDVVRERTHRHDYAFSVDLHVAKNSPGTFAPFPQARDAIAEDVNRLMVILPGGRLGKLRMQRQFLEYVCRKNADTSLKALASKVNDQYAVLCERIKAEDTEEALFKARQRYLSYGGRCPFAPAAN